MSAWDQNAALPVMSPVAAKLHDVVARVARRRCSRLPPETGVAFVTGATVANAVVPRRRPGRAARPGSAGTPRRTACSAPPTIPVVIGERAHSTLSKSLGLVGLGRDRVTVVPADDQGRMRADLLPDLDGPVLVCAQAGEVNTGAFDPFDEIADWVARAVGLAARRRRVRAVGARRPDARPPRRAASTGPTRGRPTGTSG